MTDNRENPQPDDLDDLKDDLGVDEPDDAPGTDSDLGTRLDEEPDAERNEPLPS
jgi:hypothetical protein